MDKSIQDDEIYQWSNFGENLLTHVGVIAILDVSGCFDIITIIFSPETKFYTELNESRHFCLFRYPEQNNVWISDC